VVCASPELFFELDATKRVVSRPMKGTARRGRWPAEDAERANQLVGSPKERAENLMIVDLVRNDLGRVARTGAVTVTDLLHVERHPTVWQLTSTVEAELRAGGGLVDVFDALFPPGSVTGEPKPATMKPIACLEPEPPRVYCAAVGVLTPPRNTMGRPPARLALGIG